MRSALTGFVLTLMAIVPTGAVHAQASGEQPAATAAAEPALSEAELDQLVSPIALYPDPLLANVLMASTYPIEVVEADRWADANKAMSDVDRAAALDQQSWHASVKALVSTPAVLDMMSNQLTWTQKLGQAVLASQQAVMAAVQELRAQAAAQKKLQSTEQQTVSIQTENARQVIIIEPTDPGVIYVPYYNPVVVFGPWRWPAWPPFFFPPPAGIVIGEFGIAWGIGWRYDWVVYGGFDWWHATINMRWTINVNGEETAHVESWHHGVNDTAGNFRAADLGDRGDAGARDGGGAAPALLGDAPRADIGADGGGARDQDGLGGDGADALRADRFDGGPGVGDGFGRDDFGGRGFAWRRPLFRR